MEVILRLIVLKDFFKWSFQKEEPASSLAGRLILDEVEEGSSSAIRFWSIMNRYCLSRWWIIPSLHIP